MSRAQIASETVKTVCSVQYLFIFIDLEISFRLSRCRQSSVLTVTSGWSCNHQKLSLLSRVIWGMLRRQLTEDPVLRRVLNQDIHEGYVRRDDWLIGNRPEYQNLDYNAEIREVKTRGLVQVLKRSNCCEHQRRLLVSSLVVVALTKKGGCSKTDQATTEKTINSWDSVNQSLIKK